MCPCPYHLLLGILGAFSIIPMIGGLFLYAKWRVKNWQETRHHHECHSNPET